MTLDGILFLASYGNRSRAYAQAMAAAGLSPEWTLFFGDPADDIAEHTEPCGGAPKAEGLFLPSLGEPLNNTCTTAGWQVSRCPTGDVNHPNIMRHLSKLRPRLIIYSGYSGVLVKPYVLDLGFDFLHLHAGWLPDYRGSTTIYYSLLNEGCCGVTALILDNDIDTGPIIARQQYPAPPPGINVEHLYDNAIRADLLIRVLRYFASKGDFSTTPNAGASTTYYVIHPVLKHLALLSLEPQP